VANNDELSERIASHALELFNAGFN